MTRPTMNGRALTAGETCPAEFHEILAAATCATELTIEQGLVLATAQGPAFEALVAVADPLRRGTVGDPIAYAVHHQINFTHVCFVGYTFCGLAHDPEP